MNFSLEHVARFRTHICIRSSCLLLNKDCEQSHQTLKRYLVALPQLLLWHDRRCPSPELRETPMVFLCSRLIALQQLLSRRMLSRTRGSMTHISHHQWPSDEDMPVSPWRAPIEILSFLKHESPAYIVISLWAWTFRSTVRFFFPLPLGLYSFSFSSLNNSSVHLPSRMYWNTLPLKISRPWTSLIC